MKFIRYNSIENATRIETINAIIQQGFSGGIWCATNKIHGANYQFKYDANELRCGKRSGLLGGDGGNFYGSYIVYNKYADKVKALYNHLKKYYNFDELMLYGELFGGCYPDKTVEKVSQAKKVQDDVWYCPHNDFYLFDIVLVVGDTLMYLDTEDVEKYGKQFGFPHAEIMHSGTLEEMLALDPVFEDPMYKYYDLPKLDKPNKSEGWVIRPMITSFFHSGSRVILKNKNPAFSERKQKKERKVQKPLPPEAEDLLQEGLTYVTENRLRNVLSHGHDLTVKDFGKLIGLFSSDIYEAFVKDNRETIDSMEKVMFKKVTKQINQAVANLIRPNWLNIIDKNF